MFNYIHYTDMAKRMVAVRPLFHRGVYDRTEPCSVGGLAEELGLLNLRQWGMFFAWIVYWLKAIVRSQSLTIA
jgi:hypothetical protein